MTAAELLFKIQNMKNVKGVTVQAICRDAGTDELCSKVHASVDIYVEEYAWEIRAVHLNPNSGRERNLKATNTCLELALADILVQVEFDVSGGLFN